MKDALTMTEAAKRLGITRVTLGRLVREGVLPVTENPLDKRQRLIPESAIRHMEAREARPHPRTLGSLSDPELRSDEIEEYIESQWKLD
jgi:excisionase family DNA binding protein